MNITELDIRTDKFNKTANGQLFYLITLKNNSKISIWIDPEKFKNVKLDDTLLKYLRQSLISKVPVEAKVKSKNNFDCSIKFVITENESKIDKFTRNPEMRLRVIKDLELLDTEDNRTHKKVDFIWQLFNNYFSQYHFNSKTCNHETISSFDLRLYDSIRSITKVHSMTDIDKCYITVSHTKTFDGDRQKNAYTKVVFYFEDTLYHQKVFVYDSRNYIIDNAYCSIKEFNDMQIKNEDTIKNEVKSFQDQLFENIEANGLLSVIQNDLDNAATRMTTSDANNLISLFDGRENSDHGIRPQDIRKIIYDFYNIDTDVGLDIPKIKNYKFKIEDTLILYYYYAELPKSSGSYIKTLGKFTIAHNLRELASRLLYAVDKHRITGNDATYVRKSLHNKFRNTKSNVNKEYITVVVKGTIKNTDITSIEQQREICINLNKLAEYINVDNDVEKSAFILTSVELADDYNEFIFYTKTYMTDEYSDRLISSNEALIKSGRFQQIPKTYNSIYNTEFHFSFEIITASEETEK